MQVPLATGADARRWLDARCEDWETGTRFSFAILTDGGDTPVGYIAVTPGSDANADVGYWTAAVARGRGVASRALEAVTGWAFDAHGPLAVSRLTLRHVAANRASCRVAEKCRYGLDSVLPPSPPDHPTEGHLHVRRPDD